jgi:dTDP-4-amino-4,6-dideoxygalactose transaminase
VERLADGDLDVTLAGGKHNMTDIAARIGLGQLARLEEFTARRQALARRYFQCFDRSLGCELPLEDFTNSNWHMFQIVLPAHIQRGAFIGQMHADGIGVGVHYPAIHLLTLYRQMGFNPGDFPIAEHIGRGIATLPLFPAMRDQDVERVCEQTARTVKALSGRHRGASAAIVSGR